MYYFFGVYNPKILATIFNYAKDKGALRKNYLTNKKPNNKNH